MVWHSRIRKSKRFRWIILLRLILRLLLRPKSKRKSRKNKVKRNHRIVRSPRKGESVFGKKRWSDLKLVYLVFQACGLIREHFNGLSHLFDLRLRRVGDLPDIFHRSGKNFCSLLLFVDRSENFLDSSVDILNGGRDLGVSV